MKIKFNKMVKLLGKTIEQIIEFIEQCTEQELDELAIGMESANLSREKEE